ncbi:MAG: phosphate starvation-inducible protein PhoH [Bacteroidetes bacterium GWF2_41_31]|nr:MAG: phosphate starvation-inducible protein PhoH [Bacteroidetes bacterium GWF2_41_31]OFZ07711.1 MAG: phosphate starvation-inducible protein PhoH [Bacteroidetes bacterium RIFOXYB12_FULL_41_6]
MTDRVIQIEVASPLEVFGPADVFLTQMQNMYPKLKIVARGEFLKLFGDIDEITRFENRFDLLQVHFERFGKINEEAISQIMGDDENDVVAGQPVGEDILVFGRYGKVIKAMTPNQKKMVSSSVNNELVFAIGPAGTGKTYTAVALAVRALKNKEVRKIILTRPAIEAGESLGFLPGDMKEKLDPYMQPLYDALRDMLPTQKFLSYLEDETIEIAPLAFMRGRTLSNVYAILDEAQNATEGQLKMFLTRMGKSSKFIVTGDITQIDLPRKQQSGLFQAQNILKGINGIDFIYLDGGDVVRHKLVTKIIEAYSKTEDQSS